MMNHYIATFHTHLSALMTARTLKEAGVDAKMAPVPRKLSSSCGTCMMYTWEEPLLACMDRDVEGVYQTEPPDVYKRLFTNE